MALFAVCMCVEKKPHHFECNLCEAVDQVMSVLHIWSINQPTVFSSGLIKQFFFQEYVSFFFFFFLSAKVSY